MDDCLLFSCRAVDRLYYTLSLSLSQVALLFVGLVFKKKYPVFGDRLFLREETVSYLKVVLVYLPVWFSLVLARAAGMGGDPKNGNSTFVVLYVLQQSANCTLVGCVVYCMSTLLVSRFVAPTHSLLGWPLTLPRLTARFGGVATAGERTLSLSTHNSSGTAGTASVPQTSGPSVRLKQVLRHKEGFRLFMSHLFAEISYENMLCLIECAKFKERLRMLRGEQDGDVKKFALCQYVTDTKSSIVEEMTEERASQFECVGKLCDKYINDGSQYSVNLPYLVRCEVLREAQGISRGTVSDISAGMFDGVISQCYRLMNEAFSRFVQTEDYETLMNEFADELTKC